MEKPVLLSDISSEDLIRELERRKNPTPLQVENPDFTNLVNLCQEYISDIAEQGWADRAFGIG